MMSQIINLHIPSEEVALGRSSNARLCFLSSEVTESRFKMQSMTPQACACEGGGQQRIKRHGRRVARASLDMEKDIIRLKKCLHRETKGEPRHGASGWPNANLRVIAVGNVGKLCRGEVTDCRQGPGGANRH